MPNPAPLRALVAGNRQELAGVLTHPWPWFADLCPREATYAPPEFYPDAYQAALAWDSAHGSGRPYDIVLSVLEPANHAASILPDTSRRETELSSGIGLFSWIRAHGGQDVRLIALTNRPRAWGAQGVYAALAHLLVGADVIDLTQRDSLGRPLLIPASLSILTKHGDGASNAPTAPFDEHIDDAIRAAAKDFRARAQAFNDTLNAIGSICYRGELSKPITHPLQWLRTLAKVEYEPQLLSLVAKAAAEPEQPLPKPLAALNLSLPDAANLARSRHTLSRFMAQTFDILSPLAARWLAPYEGWPCLGDELPPRFWSLPISKAARAFIDAAFPAIVFEDIDPTWLRPQRPGQLEQANRVHQ